MNFVYQTFSNEACEGILNYVRTKYRISKYIFERIKEDTAFYKYLVENYECKCSHREEYGCLSLPETFEAYNKMLTKSSRQNIRTAHNRQKRDGVKLIHQMEFDITDELADELVRIRAQRLKKKQDEALKTIQAKLYNKGRDILIRCFCEKQRIFENKNVQWVFEVRDSIENNKLVSFFYGVYDDIHHRYYTILAGVDSEYTWYSPSISHFYSYIQECYENRDEQMMPVFDFTRGGEKYKADIGCSMGYICRIIVKAPLSQ